MEAFLNVTTQQWSGYEEHRIPPEIHIYDVLLGDRIILNAVGQRCQVHISAITSDTITLEVQGLSPIDERGSAFKVGSVRQYTLPRHSSLSFSIPTEDNSPTWKIEWAEG